MTFSLCSTYSSGWKWHCCIVDITPSPNQTGCHDTSATWTYASEVWWAGETINTHDAMGVNGSASPSVAISSMQYHVVNTAWTSSETGTVGTSCGGIVGPGSYYHCKWETTTSLDVYTDDH